MKKIEYAPSARQRKEAERAKAERAAQKSRSAAASVERTAAAAGATTETASAAVVSAPARKKRLIVVLSAAALAVVLLVAALLLFLFYKKYPTDGAYATFRLAYLGRDYTVTYELQDADTAAADLGTALASFVSWTNKGVYNDSVLHAFAADSGCLEGGRYREYRPSDTGGGGTPLMNLASTENTALHDYFYSYSATKKTDRTIAARYNLSVMPYSGTMTYRWYFRLCVNDGKTNVDDLTGYVIGRATEESENVVDALYAAVEAEVENGLHALTPVEVRSVSIDGNRRTKWKKYDFFSDHSRDDYPRSTYN